MTSDRFKIFITAEKEQNEFYNSSKANNGGGYHQPYYEGFIFDRDNEDRYFFQFSNTSCGDFGTRYEIEVYQVSFNNVKNTVASAYFGSMIIHSFAYSSFDSENELHNNIKESLDNYFNIDIPTEEYFDEVV